jgi:DNA-binding response OmpR family regulator
MFSHFAPSPVRDERRPGPLYAPRMDVFEADEQRRRRRSERNAFRLAVVGTVTGIVGATTGVLALIVAVTRSRPDRTLPVAAGCELDLFAHELRRDGRLVHLRPKEFDLLAVLASHPGRAWTRRQLLDRAWGHGHDGDPRTIDVHVRWLRSKVEPEPEQPAHLVTVRGVGYRLDPPGR